MTALLIALLGVLALRSMHKARRWRRRAKEAQERAHAIAAEAMRGAPKALFCRRDTAPGQPQEWLWHIRIEGEEHFFPVDQVRDARALGQRLMPTSKHFPK